MSTQSIALITGSNRGLGLETAKQLSAQGIKVILAGRDTSQLNGIIANWKGENAPEDLVKLDITNQQDIDAVADYIATKYGHLDILVNNAGIVIEGDWVQNNSESVSLDELKTTFDVNLFGQIALTQKLLPLIKKSEQGRIVNVSSILGSLAVNADTNSDWAPVKPFAYNASKAALNLFTITLSQALAGTNIKVNSAHPGWVKTDLGTEHAPMVVEDGAKTIVQLALLDEGASTGGFYHMEESQPW
ncbi:SDR family oxidoreductase [Flocculibacter collagenilyticus]|uniref:SDR family oxidoreductase n=1 Tax=Flocculibacter collagenilyticus TaxID=2744479 RepID=UPI0018F2ACA3|nr:SDR family oxidoreductase [Flocculibacter collagenilyticus]